MSHPTEPQHDSESWRPCAPGTVSRYAKHDAGRRNRNRFTRTASIVLTGCLLLTAGYVGLQYSRSVTEFGGGLSCAEVMDGMDAFFAGEMTAEFRARVLMHLDYCHDCSEHYQRRATEIGAVIAQQERVPNDYLPSGSARLSSGLDHSLARR